jgi:hypothetical protein
MVKVTLSTMLATIQNRHPLPNAKGLLRGGQLHLEHYVFHDCFQVG